MIPNRLAIVLLLLVAAVVTSDGRQASQPNRPWPPGLQRVNEDASPALMPEAEAATFYMPPGYHVELVASEPMIEEPILIDWDPEGRLWVIEMRGYMNDMPATTEREPLGRISVLEDTDNDGKMDKKTVFLDGLVLPRALKVLDHGVLIGEPPHLWLAHDTNGDLRADSKELLCDCYGTEMANVEHNANSLLWALDNWMYTSEHTGYLRLKNGKFEFQPTMSRGQWGASQDDAGHIYRNSNSSALHIDVLPARYFMRNSDLVRTRGSYEFMGDQNELNASFPVRPTRGVNRGYQDGQLRSDGSLATYTAVNSPVVYRGDRLPAELYGNVFVAEPAGNLVSRMIVNDDGTMLRARKAYANAEFLASTDERFRPVYLSNAPDGTLYIVDIYHGIIQHRGFITEYLRDHIVSHNLETPIHKGRIWRVVHDTTRRDQKPSLSSESPARLVDRLAHPNGWWRDTAQRLLVERGDRSVVPILTDRALHAADFRTRLHALWTLDGMDAIEAPTVIQALSDSSRDVRVSALRLSERWLAEPNPAVQAAVLKRLDDADWNVRIQLAATLGAMPDAASRAATVTILERFGNDPMTLDTVLSGLKGREAAVLGALLDSTAESPQRTAAVSMLAATIMKSAQPGPVRTVIDLITDNARASWQRLALARGAEAGLQGVAPGAGRSAAAAPAAAPAGGAVRGARNGPGGAPAFPVASAPRGAGPRAGGAAGAEPAPVTGRGRGAAIVTMQLSSEPAQLVSLAAQDKSELGQRASNMLASLGWPGKPGVAPKSPPLTPEEQQRFAAGQEVYASICFACHQADGKGKEQVAPSLIGSALALGDPGIPIRILLNGKEGPIGLMPPLGQTFTDDQVAAVLTFIRRQWGNAASAVDPATVKTLRAETASRTRPWTNDELTAIGAAGRGGRE